MLVLWYFVFGIALESLSVSSSPLDLTSSAREEKSHSEAFKHVEQTLLTSMGLKTRPRPRRDVRVPQYMKDLYHSDKDHPEWSSTNFRFNDKWTSVNTVRAFHSQVDLPTSQAADIPGHSIIKFDLSTFPKYEDVHSAKLRLYKSDSWRKANDTEMRIKLYRVLQPNIQSTEQSTRLIDSKLVNLTESGWESFDVRSSVEHWIENPANNYGIQVHIASIDGNNVNVSSEERPFLVTFSHDSRKHHHVRRKRSNHAATNNSKPERPGELCERHPLNVDFKALGWDTWIIAPRKYSAFNCAGKCTSDCIPTNRSSNHAIVLQYKVRNRASNLPHVCCVPTKLSPLSILYFEDNGDIVLSKFNNMIVEECGCTDGVGDHTNYCLT